MRKIVFLSAIWIAASFISFGQKAKEAGCNEPKVHNKLVALNKDLEAKKYKLVLFTTDNIPSKTYVPIRVELEKGTSYQINFVASSNASRYELRLADQHKKQWIKQKAKAEKGGVNVLSKTFTPAESGAYLIVVLQQTKGNECVGVSVLKK